MICDSVHFYVFKENLAVAKCSYLYLKIIVRWITWVPIWRPFLKKNSQKEEKKLIEIHCKLQTLEYLFIYFLVYFIINLLFHSRHIFLTFITCAVYQISRLGLQIFPKAAFRMVDESDRTEQRLFIKENQASTRRTPEQQVFITTNRNLSPEKL